MKFVGVVTSAVVVYALVAACVLWPKNANSARSSNGDGEDALRGIRLSGAVELGGGNLSHLYAALNQLVPKRRAPWVSAQVWRCEHAHNAQRRGDELFDRSGALNSEQCGVLSRLSAAEVTR